MKFDLRPCALIEVRELCSRFHGYQSAGGTATYCFGVFEVPVGDSVRQRPESPRQPCGSRAEEDSFGAPVLVAAYAWQPPSPGAALSTAPEAPHAVLMLSRMVALPKEQRALKHVSKPLKLQMHQLLDRTRWPVLVTYSDEGEGHTGYVYKCSGWTPTLKTKVKTFEDAEGRRCGPYSNGGYAKRQGVKEVGTTVIQRWEHWVCDFGYAGAWLKTHGWTKVEIPGKKWRSGNQAYRYERREM